LIYILDKDTCKIGTLTKKIKSIIDIY